MKEAPSRQILFDRATLAARRRIFVIKCSRMCRASLVPYDWRDKQEHVLAAWLRVTAWARGWRGARGRCRGRGGDDGGRDGRRGWKISVSCPRVGEFFACRLGNTEGRWKRGPEESKERERAGNCIAARRQVEARRVEVVAERVALVVGINAESWKQKIPKETLDSRYRWGRALCNWHKGKRERDASRPG